MTEPIELVRSRPSSTNACFLELYSLIDPSCAEPVSLYITFSWLPPLFLLLTQWAWAQYGQPVILLRTLLCPYCIKESHVLGITQPDCWLYLCRRKHR